MSDTDLATATPTADAAKSEVPSGHVRFTLLELRQMEAGLQRMTARELPIKLSWKFAGLMRKLQPEYEELAKKNAEIVQRFGVPAVDEKGQTLKDRYTISDENMAAYDAAIKELNAVEIDVPFTLISIDDLSSVSAVTPQELYGISKLIAE